MAVIMMIVVSLCALFTPAISTTAFSSAQIQEIVEAHNTMRRWESGDSNMNVLKWNDELADMAQDYVDLCTGGHGQPDRTNPPFEHIGQNIYMTQAASIDNVTAVVENWYSEKQWYTYSTNQCTPPPNKSCGHYTQVVWGDTTDVGCGFNKTCDNHAYPTQVYCNYGPRGNWIGEKPYSLGSACTACASGSGWCNDGLCDGSCTGSSGSCSCAKTCQNCGDVDATTCKCNCKTGYLGESCETECADTHVYCGGNPGWPVTWCKPETQYVLDACPAFCGTCTPSTSDPCA